MIKKIAAVLAAGLMMLTGCSSKSEGYTFRYDLPYGIQSLDPQFARDEYAAMIIENIYEGLLKRNADGTIGTAAAESYKTNPEGTMYTFYLKDGKWSDGTAVTSADFAFAFRRLFDPNAPSPYASGFSAIKNAKQVLEGRLPAENLGISTPDERTLVIELEHPDPFFLQLLCTSAAMPAKKEFFEETRGRYGLSPDAILCNGPFKVSRWDNEKVLVIGKSPHFRSVEEVKPEAVYFYVGRENPSKLLFDGKSDLAKIGYDDLRKAQKKKLNIITAQDKTWVLAFNQNKKLLADKRIRQALQTSIDRQDIIPILEKNMSISSSVVPPAAKIYENSYRKLAGPPFEPIYNPMAAKEMFTATLKEMEINKIAGLTIIMPEYGDILSYAGMVQQLWQANLALFVNIEALPQSDFNSRINSGDFDIAIMPLQLKSEGPQGVLSMFTTGSSQNVFGFSNEVFDQAVNAALSATGLATALESFTVAEDIIIQEAVVVPLYSETSYIAINKDVKQLVVSPFGDILFKDATCK